MVESAGGREGYARRLEPLRRCDSRRKASSLVIFASDAFVHPSASTIFSVSSRMASTSAGSSARWRIAWLKAWSQVTRRRKFQA